MGVSFWGDENALDWNQRCWLHNTVNVLNATELYTLKGLPLCGVNFIPIKETKGMKY